MRHDDGVEEPILELNRDRGSGPATPIQDRLTLFADQAAQLVDVEKPMRVRRREDAAGSAGDCAHSGPALGELATRFDEALDERLAGLEGLLCELEQRLNRSPCHPACPVLAVVLQLFDPGGKARHIRILPARRPGHNYPR